MSTHTRLNSSPIPQSTVGALATLSHRGVSADGLELSHLDFVRDTAVAGFGTVGVDETIALLIGQVQACSLDEVIVVGASAVQRLTIC